MAVLVARNRADPSARTGFGARLHHLTAALLDVCDVRLILISDDEQDGQIHSESVVPTGVHPLAEGGWHGRARKLRWFARGPSLTNRPKSIAPLRAAVGSSAPPALVILHSAYAAPLVTSIPADIPVLWLAEERLVPGGPDEISLWPGRRGWLPAQAARAERRHQRAEIRAALRRADLVLCISDEEAAAIRRVGRGAGQVEVLRHGVDTDWFAPAPKPAALPDLDIVIVGVMDERNRPGTVAVLDAARGRGWRIAVVGKGASTLAGRFPDVELADDVDDVRPYYRRARVAVVPADTGLGVKTTLLQAWAMNRAVVASPQSARGAPVVAGTNALLGVDAPAIAAAAARLLADDAGREKLADAGRATVVAQADIRAIAIEFADRCARLVTRPR